MFLFICLSINNKGRLSHHSTCINLLDSIFSKERNNKLCKITGIVQMAVDFILNTTFDVCTTKIKSK